MKVLKAKQEILVLQVPKDLQVLKEIKVIRVQPDHKGKPEI
jgi:hypothetical protein